MAEIDWIKITTRMFDDEKIKMILTLPEGYGIFTIWILLLAQAGKSNQNGYIMFTEKIMYTPESLSSVYNVPLNLVKVSLKTFVELDMIEQDEENNGAFYLKNWHKYQNVEGMERVKELTQKRVQKHRLNKKMLSLNEGVTESNVTCNGDVTQSTVTCNGEVTVSNAESNVTVTQCNAPRSKILRSKILDLKNNTTTTSSNYVTAEENSNDAEASRGGGEIPLGSILLGYNKTCTRLDKIIGIDGDRLKAVTACWKKNPDIDYFLKLFEIANQSDYLCGYGPKGWKANFDWIINQTNRTKILEGFYKNRPKVEGTSNKAMTSNNGRLPNYANFDQREYTEEELEKYCYMVNVPDTDDESNNPGNP